MSVGVLRWSVSRRIMIESSSSKGAWQRGKFSEKEPIFMINDNR